MPRLLVLLGLVGLVALSGACEERPDKAYERGVEEWNEGNFSAAVERLRGISRKHPDSEYAAEGLLRAARIQGRDLRWYDEAISSYQLVQALYPDSPQARRALEELIRTRFQHTEDYVGVIIDGERYIEHFPDSSEVPVTHHFIVRSYLRLHEFEHSRNAAKRFLEQYPDHDLADDMAYIMLRSLFVSGQNEAAVKEARRQLEERADSTFRSRTHFLLGGALEELDRLQEALEAFQAAKSGYPARDIVQSRMDAVQARMERKYDD